jgi:amino acid adenylation domain-containing protein
VSTRDHEAGVTIEPTTSADTERRRTTPALEHVADFAAWIDEALERSLRDHAAAPALVRGGETLSYAELDARSAALAERLAAGGVEPGHAVVVLARRPTDALVAFVAALRRRWVFVPLAADDPPARLFELCERVAPAAIVVIDGAPGAFAPHAALAVDRDGLGAVVGARRSRRFEAGDACVFFTSGTTGRPRGVVGTRAALAHYVAWEAAALEAAPGWRYSQIAPVSFDAIVPEMILPLVTGGVICAPPGRPAEMSSRAFVAWVRDAGIAVLDCVPSMFALLTGDGAASFPALRFVLMAGEPPRIAPLRRWFAGPPGPARLFNCYGLTESTVVSTLQEITSADVAAGAIPIGAPIHGVELRLLDAVAGPGGALDGELALVSRYLARGYLDDPDATAARFGLLADGRGALATGDRVRWQDGRVAYLGRRDRAIKVRGKRVDLAEVEAVLQAAPGVADAIVLAERGETSGIVAAAILADPAAGTAALRAHLADLLPAEALPRAIVVVERWPRGATDKVDEAALLALARATARATDPGAAPLDDLDQAVLAAWREVLGDPALGADADYAAAGGDSLAAMAIAGLLDPLGVEVATSDFARFPTARALAAALRERGVRSSSSTAAAAAPTRYPPHIGCASLLAGFRDAGEVPAGFNLVRVYGLRGVAPEVVERAFAVLVARHASLRSRLDPAAGPIALRVDEPRFDLTREDARDVAIDPAWRAALVGRLTARGFALADAPLRIHVVREADDALTVVLSMSHAVADEWSLEILDRELAALCAAGGDPAALPAKPIDFPAFAVALAARADAAEAERQRAWWRAWLADARVTPVPDAGGDAAAAPTAAGLATATLDAGRADRLERARRRLGVSRPSALLACYAALCRELCATPEVVIASPLIDRQRPEAYGLVGCCLNLAIWRFAGAADELDALAAAAHAQYRAIAARQDIAVIDVLDELGRAELLYGNRFNYYRTAAASHGAGFAVASPFPDESRFVWALYVEDAGDRIELSLRYQRRRHGAAFAAAALARFTALVDRLTAA